MKQVFRYGTFETNSSSCHNMVVYLQPNITKLTKEDVIKNIKEYDCVSINGDPIFDESDKTLHIDRLDQVLLDFGSERAVYSDFMMKLLYTFASYNCDSDIISELILFLQTFLGIDNVKFDTRTSYAYWYDENECRKEVPYYGEVDHQSVDLMDSFIKNSEITIMDFLLDPRYTITSQEG